jgi:hypothetical protein
MEITVTNRTTNHDRQDYLNQSLCKMIGVSSSNHFCQELHSGS